MELELFAAVVFGSTAAIPLLLFLYDRAGKSKLQLTPFGIFAASIIAFLLVAWLVFAGTFLFWIFPIAVLGSIYLGYLLGGLDSLASTNELWVAVLSIGVAGAIAIAEFALGKWDRSYGYLPNAVMLANYAALLGTATVRIRRRASARAHASTLLS